MKYIADLHVHSLFSRATSKASNLEGFYQWAKIKGIGLVGTGDFTHPGWYRELKEKLVPVGNGFFELASPPPDEVRDAPEARARGSDIGFVLSCEISSIYKKNGKTHKVHSIIFAPDLDVVSAINAQLGKIGNIGSDGRPILGLDPKILLEIVKSVSAEAELIPAHIWTPWFSVFGSNSGFDSIEECFEELSGEIFALETGLSSDPSMNWRVSDLDKYTLVSNSDAHSPQKLGREANVFDTEYSYRGMFRALKTGNGFLGTYEFYPEEGKYHYDGHRKCSVCLDPEESRKLKCLCPACGKPLTVGVMHRVLELADRPAACKPDRAAGFRYIIPLAELISEILKVGPSSKTVQAAYSKIVSAFGSEFSFLVDAPPEEAEHRFGPAFREALVRMRSGKVTPNPGYDGEFGTIRVFTDDELLEFAGQGSLFELPRRSKRTRSSDMKNLGKHESLKKKGPVAISREISLDSDQERVIGFTSGFMLVAAGPGSGKTRTLTSWIEHLACGLGVAHSSILAITFTNRAATEMKERLRKSMPGESGNITITTFHGFAFDLIRKVHPEIVRVYDERDRLEIVSHLFPERGLKEARDVCNELSGYFEGKGSALDPKTLDYGRVYIDTLKRMGGIDIALIIRGANQILEKDRDILASVRNRFRFIAVDEIQDINTPQYELISHLFPLGGTIDEREDRAMLAIGDPDQAIYGFRGANLGLFASLADEGKPIRIALSRNYRSSGSIVGAAASVISHNPRRFGSAPVCMKDQGEKITVFNARDVREETRFILEKIDEYVGGIRFESASNREDCFSFSDIAICARTGSVLESIGRELRTKSVPVHLRNSVSLGSSLPFSRIKNVLSFLANEKDTIASMDVLFGLLDIPKKWDLKVLLGDRTDDSTLPEMLVSRQNISLEPGDKEKIDRFMVNASALRKLLSGAGIADCIARLIELYPSLDPKAHGLDIEGESFLDCAREYRSDLLGFLRRLSLDVHEDETPFNADKVSLMTFHASKGLEFPIVFIAGAIEGITPIVSRNADIEEERRLFYVAMTRAREKLFISYSSVREMYGEFHDTAKSRFIDEISSELVALDSKPRMGRHVRENGQPLLDHLHI